MKRKAIKCIDELTKYIWDIQTDTDYIGSDFQKGYIYGLKVAIQVISRVFEIVR